MRTLRSFSAAAGVLLAQAVVADGSIEIHQACVATGCFAGDAPGYPVEITASGRYRLTSDLHVPFVTQAYTGIEINASDVTLDLGGHALTSDVTCSGLPPNCTLSLFGRGITVPSSQVGISIANGMVRGFGISGISTTAPVESLRLERLTVRENGVDGIEVNGSGRVDSVTVVANREFGVLLDGQFEIRNSLLQRNGREGVTGGICRDLSLEDNGDATASGEQLCNRLVGDNLCGAAPC